MLGWCGFGRPFSSILVVDKWEIKKHTIIKKLLFVIAKFGFSLESFYILVKYTM